jgi:CRP/FNR family transcriptional regulator, cyclic AMP receptor protein
MATKVVPLKLGASRLVATVGHGRTKVDYQTERVIFSQGDPSDSVFYMLQGKVKIVVTSKSLSENIMRECIAFAT